MLSINPVRHAGELMLYVANLQDYSYQMTKLISLTPSQFCRSSDHHQRHSRLADLAPRSLAKPTIYEADDEAPLPTVPLKAPLSLGMPIKRLGWQKLNLEPEHLADRVIDALVRMDAAYDLTESPTAQSEVFLVVAKVNDVSAARFDPPAPPSDFCVMHPAAPLPPIWYQKAERSASLPRQVAIRVLVTEDTDGSYRISCTRAGGDTFAYHSVFRELVALLGDGFSPSETAPRVGMGVAADVAELPAESQTACSAPPAVTEAPTQELSSG